MVSLPLLKSKGRAGSYWISGLLHYAIIFPAFPASKMQNLRPVSLHGSMNQFHRISLYVVPCLCVYVFMCVCVHACVRVCALGFASLENFS